MMVEICLEDVSSVAPVYLYYMSNNRTLWRLLGHPGPRWREKGSQMKLLRLAASNPNSGLWKVNSSVTTGETRFLFIS